MTRGSEEFGLEGLFCLGLGLIWFEVGFFFSILVRYLHFILKEGSSRGEWLVPKAKKCSEFQAILGYSGKACLKWGGGAAGEIARGLKYSPFLEKTLVQLLLPT